MNKTFFVIDAIYIYTIYRPIPILDHITSARVYQRAMFTWRACTVCCAS